MSASTLTTVYLVGSLGRRFGEKWELDVMSPGEAVRAIDINTRGALGAFLCGPAKNRPFKVALQRKDNAIDKEEATHRSGRSTIYIIPTIRGRDKGFTKIIIGAALIALSFVPGVQAFTIPALGLKAGFLSTMFVAFGASLVLGGISQLLTPRPETPKETEERLSKSFDGNASTVVQGGCVPVVYGRALVPAIPISISIENNDVSVTDSGEPPGDVDGTELPGGGIQYDPA